MKSNVDRSGAQEINFSIVIPTYNRATLLEAAIKSVSQLRIPDGSQAEVLVIDNNSTDNTIDIVASAAANSPFPIRYILEERQGASHVRNRAIVEARFEHLVYLDDDMTSVASDWLEAYLRVLHEFQPDCVIGPVYPDFEHPPAKWMTPALLRCTAEYSRKGETASIVSADQAHEIPGCNFAVKKSVANEVGGFHPDLGPAGGASIRGEDFEFGEQLVLHGKRVAYAPACRISHLVSAQKMSEAGLRARWEGDGVTERYSLRIRGKELPSARRLRLAARLLRFAGISLMARLCGRREQALKYELRALQLKGYLFAGTSAVRPRSHLTHFAAPLRVTADEGPAG